MSYIVQVNRNELYKNKGNLKYSDKVQLKNLNDAQINALTELLYSLYEEEINENLSSESCA